VSPILQIYCLVSQASDRESIAKFLAGDRFNVTSFDGIDQLSKSLIADQSNQDCLIIWVEELSSLRLVDLGICLPIVIVTNSAYDLEHSPSILDKLPTADSLEFVYPLAATVSLKPENSIELPEAIERAIALFLNIPTKLSSQLSDNSDRQLKFDRLANAQQRLSQKLKERLGYLGIYYKRDSKQFWRRLSEESKANYTQRLQEIYRSIILEYFKDKSKHLNTLIDEFASVCFFADISVSQVLQIHMELMEDFSKQLRFEGRNEEVLLDYRITLIDVIAHLCEMYRRSIPKDL
jgi:circadian clock protein KaiA